MNFCSFPFFCVRFKCFKNEWSAYANERIAAIYSYKTIKKFAFFFSLFRAQQIQSCKLEKWLHRGLFIICPATHLYFVCQFTKRNSILQNYKGTEMRNVFYVCFAPKRSCVTRARLLLNHRLNMCIRKLLNWSKKQRKIYIIFSRKNEIFVTKRNVLYIYMYSCYMFWCWFVSVSDLWLCSNLYTLYTLFFRYLFLFYL